VFTGGGGGMNAIRWCVGLALGVAVALSSGCSCRALGICSQVGDSCSSHEQCCSFGCAISATSSGNTCACNPLPSGLCVTSRDCCGGLKCVTGACQTGCRAADDYCLNPG